MGKVDQIISEQVLTWARREAKSKQRKEPAGTWPVITISREFGARGGALAKKLSKHIDFKVWDKELLTAITKETGADERFIASLDERRRKLIEDALYGSFLGSKHSNTHYFRSLMRVVQTIGVHGKGILVGRGSNYIIDSPDALRIRIVCPIETRIAYIAKLEGISEKNAEKIINARDAERADFIRHYFKRDSANPGDYDLVLNSGVFNIDQLAEITLLAYEKKAGKSVPRIE